LGCNNNQLTNLNLSGLTNLQTLSCTSNLIPTLNLIGLTNLTYLNCAANQLTTLDTTPLTSLINLDCSSNQITNLNLSLPNLTELNCSNNPITTLNVSALPNLTTLGCYYGQLTNLIVTGLTQLNRIEAGHNQLSSLNISTLTNLTHLGIDYNLFTTIDLSNNLNLISLNCNNNFLTTLDVSNASNFNYLNCSDNNLSTLFIKNGVIETTVNNGMDFSGNPNLQYICADEGQLASIQTKITEYGYTNCHVNSYCSFTPGGTFYTIQGNNRYDSNDNGCDASDINFPNFKLSFTDGTNTGNYIADTTGAFHYDVQAGSQTFTPILENPAYFNVSPLTSSVTFPSTTSPFTQNFCITANGVKNDLEVTIIPIEVARPGFDAFYKIIYKNKGNQVANGSLSFTFNDAIMDLVTASPIVNTTGTNSLSWNYANLNPLETREINLTFNINSPMETPAVNGGDVLNYNATIIGATDETPNDNTFTLNQTVVNSFDPNDKTCLEGTTITPSMVGNYVHYVIRFENTGTFAAQNVVIKDMIDTTKFDMASLIPQSSSHPFVTRITNTNQVEFIFENINLPFNDATNDGYVAFKIKTKSTLVLGNTFSNTANIYFDFNFPIVTNIATTTIAALSNQDFDFGSYFSVYPNPAKDVLHLATKNEIGVKAINIYNILGQMLLVVTNPENNVPIHVSNLKTGTYFIKVLTDKGTANTKFVKE
jgi:hypothetical protein